MCVLSIKVSIGKSLETYLMSLVDLARELNMLWNMRVTMLLILIGALGTDPKGLERSMEGLEIGCPLSKIERKRKER